MAQEKDHEPIRGNNPRHEDLRDVIRWADEIGELVRVEGADWNLEIGTLAEIFCHEYQGKPPAILFEKIPGYPEDFRVLSGITNSARRLSYILGFGDIQDPIEVVRSYRQRMREDFTLREPNFVEDGPLLENIERDENVDLYKFPAPFLHEEDGGRYIGTNDLVILRDPETGWVNIGTYRVCIHDRNTAGIWISPGKHGRLIREKYFKQGDPCPIAISLGHDPLLFLASGHEIDLQLSEYLYAGGHREKPFDVLESELHGLPIPATSEIVIEGEILPDEKRSEGPFGEFTGYYASKVREEPVVRIRRVYHRDAPVLTMASPMRPPSDMSFGKSMVQSAMIWDEIEKAGLPGVESVWCHEAGGVRMFIVIAIKQMYAGHAKQAGLLVGSSHSGNYLGRWVVVVDDDIDPTNLFDVTWAISTRCDPAQNMDLLRDCWSSPLDPMLREPPWQNSRAIIDACRPYGWGDDFPKVSESSPELRQRIREKWADAISAYGRADF